MSINTYKLSKFLSFLGLFLFCLFISCTSLFAEADPKVYDYANLFTLEEVEELEQSAKSFANQYQMDIGIMTTEDTKGQITKDYANDFYENNNYGFGSNYDGLLLVIDMDNRQVYITTEGSGTKYFTDLRISKMLDLAYGYLSNEDYYNTATDFLKNAASYMEKGIPSNQYSEVRDFSDPRVDYNNPYMTEAGPKHEPFKTASGQYPDAANIGLSALIALIGAAIIAFIIRAVVQYRYKHPHYTVPTTVPDDSSVHYTEREDRFVTTHTTRVKIENHNNGGGSGSGSGRSSINISSSGRSHGGGGRSF